MDKTLKELAKEGQITPEMEACAKAEGVSPEYIREGLAQGTIVLCKNKKSTSLSPVPSVKV